jgi:small subunit ribosomal protein S17
MNKQRNKRKIREGTVLSNRMNKTIVVRVDSLTKHKRYGRVIRRSAKFKVHDEQNQAKLGEKVRIMETGPLSKEKRWRLIEVIK